MTDITEYPIISKFTAFIRRPSPLESGMVAQLFGANGDHADAINELGKTKYFDSLVAVEMFTQAGESMDGFKGYIRRPKPLQSGMVAQIFGENGPDADTIAALSLSKWLDQELCFQVRLIQDAEGRDKAHENNQKKIKGPYSDQAQVLWKSAFFRNPKVWQALGTDDQYLAWLKTQTCPIKTKLYGPHEGDIVPMHVRRVANGAGVARKPPYSAIPGCWKHHQMQTDHGESAVGGREMYDKLRIRYLQRWSWEQLTAAMGCESMSEVEPIKVYEWAKTHRLERYLPLQYSLANFNQSGS